MFANCIAEIQRAAGRDLSDEELDELLSELERRRRQRRAEDRAASEEEVTRGAAETFARDLAAMAAVERRNAAINQRIRIEAEDFIRSQFPDDLALGLQAFMTGANRLRNGSRNSASAMQEGLVGKYMGGLTADLEKAGMTRVFTSGALDREISLAMWARNRDVPRPVNVPAEAITIADILTKWSEVARDDANRAGAWIGREQGYIVRQSHEFWKVSRAGFDEWRAAIEPRLDWDRIGDVDRGRFLRGAFDGIVSGVHLRSEGAGDNGFNGDFGRNIASRASEQRTLHFRSAEDWYEYNRVFGRGTMREAFLSGLRMSAQNTGLMRTMGTNPQATYQHLTERLLQSLPDPLAQRTFREKVADGGSVHNHLAAVDGSMNVPVNALAAQIQSSVQAWTRMTIMGMSLLSQASDIPVRAAEMRYQGQGFLPALVDAATGIFTGRKRQELIELDGDLGIFREMFATNVASRFSIADDGLPGSISKAQGWFFKLNGMAYVTDNQRASSIRAMSHRLALNRDVSFAQADDGLKRVLQLFDIGEAEWKALRAAPARLADGRDYVTPQSILSAPDEAFVDMVRRSGRKVSPQTTASAKELLADRLRNYLRDRAGYMTIAPDERTRAITMRGSRPGSVQGVGMRAVWELKGFAAAVIQKAWGREIYGRGSDTLREAITNGNGEMLGLANMIMWQTIFGYLSMAAKDAITGKVPRVPEDREEARAIMQAAFLQGGGAGIYGDFLFGEVNRYGGGLLPTLAGPTVGKAESLYSLYGRVREGDDASAAAFWNVVRNVPGNNLFYTKLALDYLVLWNMQEWVNPGSIRRMERRVERENGQTFFIRPTDAIR